MGVAKKKILRSLIGVLLAFLFLYITLQGKDLKASFEIIKQAHIKYLIASIIFYLLSFIARSEKWRIQVESLGEPVSAKASYFALMMHYFVNAFTIKLGVFARCISLRKTTNIPLARCIASFFSESLFDIIFLFIGLFAVMIIEAKKVSKILNNFLSDLGVYIKSHIAVYITLFLSIIIFIVLYFLFSKGLIFKKFYKNIREFNLSIKKTFKLKKYPLFLFWNLVLWGLLYAMNFAMFKALFGTVDDYVFVLALTTFTYAAWLIPTPGGIGSVEYIVLQVFLLYGFIEHEGVAFGIMSNALTFFTVMIFSLFLYLFDKLTGFFSTEKIHK